MSSTKNESEGVVVDCFDRLAQLADYSLLNALQADPESTESGEDYFPRQVFSGHYVPVKPMPISKPEYVSHSATLFAELGFDEALAHSEAFKQLFSGDMSALPAPMKRVGWATGYALSIYGTEYTQQCPFQTGNGYGDGRAVSILELVSKGKRWEFQLKGGGRTPYCRGADGRAVLRSSVREFLAQEHMHALGIQTSRSLCLFTSLDERVDRPWYTEGATHPDPNILVSNPVAISTRVAPSFLRVGQIELFGRRARSHAHPNALRELEMIVLHLIDREYPNQIDAEKPIEEKVIELVSLFRDRLIELVTNWIRVGFCQGNFNSDNCAGGGFTLDYGPFGFCEMFDPYFQPWTGGGRHFSFLNQPAAAKENFMMLCTAVRPLLETHAEALKSLEDIQQGFASLMQCKLDAMWAQKLGVPELDQDLFVDLIRLMANTPVDFNMFFRELSGIPHDIEPLVKSFYREPPAEMKHKWEDWLSSWHQCIGEEVNLQALSEKMKQVNPKYTWREWLVVPAYQSAMEGDYSLIEELKTVLSSPYDEQTADIEAKYYRLRPSEFYRAGGVSHYSCSS